MERGNGCTAKAYDGTLNDSSYQQFDPTYGYT